MSSAALSAEPPPLAPTRAAIPPFWRLDADAPFSRTVYAVIVALTIALYLSGATSQWRVSADSVAYLELSRSLAAGEGYVYQGEYHTKFPPGFPAWLAGLRLLGCDSMQALNLGMATLGLLSIVAAYLLLREWTAPRPALVLAIGSGLLHESWVFTYAQLSDVPFLCFATFGLWCWVRGLKGGRGWLEAGTLILAACCWVRIVGAPLLAGAALGLYLQRGQVTRPRLIGNLIASGAAIALAMGFYTMQYLISQSSPTAMGYHWEAELVSERAWHAWLWLPFYNFYMSGQQLGTFLTSQDIPPAIALVAIWWPTLVGLRASFRNRQYIVALAAIVYLGALVVLRASIARYYIPVAPFLLWCYAAGLMELWKKLPAVSWNPQWAPAAIVGVFLLMNAVKDVREVVFAWRYPHADFYTKDPDFPRLVALLRQRPEPTQICGALAPQLVYITGHKPVGWPRHFKYDDPATSAGSIRQLGIQWLVFPKAPPSHAFKKFQAFADAAPGFQRTYRSGRYEVFEPSPLSPISAERASSPPLTADAGAAKTLR
ncbi:MAG TPA: hypothetical protein VGE52_11660 [Pirellulales bacterium]